MFTLTCPLTLDIFYENVWNFRFWIQIKQSSTPSEKATGYRKLQLLNILGNQTEQYALAVVISGSILTLSSSFATLVRLAAVAKDNNWMMKSVFGIAAVDAGVTMLVVLGGMVGAYLDSKRMLERIRGMEFNDKRVKLVERRWMKRFLRSCTLIKIKFGGSNFIEELTPVKCLDFAVQMTVQLLLLS